MVLLLLYGVLALLFVAGYAARYVPPRHLWWLQLIAIGLPYLGVMVLGATPLVALAGPRRLLVLHLALCLLVAVRFLPTARLGGWLASADGSAPTLKVMTYNLWPKNPQVENWRATNALFQTERPDLAALQEMPRWFSAVEFMYAPTSVSADSSGEGARWEEVMRAQNAGAPRYYETLLDVPESCRSGQVFLSQLAFLDQDEVEVAEDPEGCKHVVRARLAWQGQTFSVYTVHLRSFTYKPWRDLRGRWLDVGLWGEMLRQTEVDLLARAEEAEAVAAMLAREMDPFILCGDFNSTPHNWEYGRLGRGLTDAYAAAGSGWGPTYHTHNRFARIDFILVSPAWYVVSAHVVEAPLSDHLPVVAELALR